MKTKILILLSVISLIACKKSKDVEPEPAPELKTYFYKTTSSLGNYTWSYDTQNRLQAIVFVSANESANKSYTESITAYDAQNRISEGKYDYNDPAVQDFRYVATYNANGKLEKKQFYNVTTGATDSYETATYPSASQTMYNSYRADGSLSFCDVYTATADLKNIADIKRYNSPNGTGTLLSTSTYTNYNSTITNYTKLYPIGYGFAPLQQNVSGVTPIRHIQE